MCLCREAKSWRRYRVTLDPTDCRDGRSPLSMGAFVTPTCLPAIARVLRPCHFKSAHNVFHIRKQVILQQQWLLAKGTVFMGG